MRESVGTRTASSTSAADNRPTSERTTEHSTKILSGQEIFKKCNSAVFMIFTSTGRQDYQGFGFFISSNGLAVSNYHVFEGTGIGLETIKLTDDSEYKLAEVVYKDKENDVMIFSVDAPAGKRFNYMPLSTHKPQVGDRVFAIGSPLGLENTSSSSEISQSRESNLIQISVPIDHGSSGGALINEYGEVIGITSAGMEDSGANLNFAGYRCREKISQTINQYFQKNEKKHTHSCLHPGNSCYVWMCPQAGWTGEYARLQPL